MLADGGSDCQTAGTAEWRQQLSKADSMLDGLLQAVQEFHTVYQQVSTCSTTMLKHFHCVNLS